MARRFAIYFIIKNREFEFVIKTNKFVSHFGSKIPANFSPATECKYNQISNSSFHTPERLQYITIYVWVCIVILYRSFYYPVMIRTEFRTDGFDLTNTQKYTNKLGDPIVISFIQVFEFFYSPANPATTPIHEGYVLFHLLYTACS